MDAGSDEVQGIDNIVISRSHRREEDDCPSATHAKMLMYGVTIVHSCARRVGSVLISSTLIKHACS